MSQSGRSFSQQHWKPLVVVVGTLLFLLIVSLTSTSHSLPIYISSPPPSIPPRTGPELHLLIPLSTLPPPSLVKPTFTPPYCKTILTSLIQGYEPIILDLGTPHIYHDGLNAKIDVMADFVETLDEQRLERIRFAEEEGEDVELAEEDVLLMIDGWDVLLTGSPEEVLEKYRRKPNQVLLGADKTCWPLQHEIPCLERPSSPHPEEWYADGEPPRYFQDSETHLTWSGAPSAPNSGVILGPVSLLSSVYQHFTTSPNASFSRGANQIVNDQELFVVLYYTDHVPASDSSHTNFSTEIDFDSSISANLVVAYHDWDFPSPTSNSPPRWINKHTKEDPPLVHFNGKPGKILLEETWKGLWWVREKEVRRRFEARARSKEGLGVWVGGSRKGEGEWRDWKGLGCDGVWDADQKPPPRLSCSAESYYSTCGVGDIASVPYLSSFLLVLGISLVGVLMVRFVIPVSARWRGFFKKWMPEKSAYSRVTDIEL